MGTVNTALYAFNRGVVSPLALARVDQARLALSAETQVNWMPRVAGSMMLRPGWKYLDEVPQKPYCIPFKYSTSDSSILEFSDNALRIWTDDALVRSEVVTATIQDGAGFITGWTTSTHTATGIYNLPTAENTTTFGAGDYYASNLLLIGNKRETAFRQQNVVINELNTLHTFRVDIQLGECRVRLGSPLDNSFYFDQKLPKGVHFLSITPTTNVVLRLENDDYRAAGVRSVSIESNSILTLPTGYTEADLPNIRYSQSADTVYIVCKGKPAYILKRRARTSWSLERYEFKVPPLNNFPTVDAVISQPEGFGFGTVVLQGQAGSFSNDDIGGRIEVTSRGQRVFKYSKTATDYSDSIKVTGDLRGVSISSEAPAGQSFILEVSYNDSQDWQDYLTVNGTGASVTQTQAVGSAGETIYIRVKGATDYASVRLAYDGGERTTYGEITNVSLGGNTATVNLDEYQELFADSTNLWRVSKLDANSNSPDSVRFFEGRLFFTRGNEIFGSVIDDFGNFSLDVEGDSGAIIRTLNIGEIDDILWSLPLNRLVLGTEGSELSARSGSFDEPLTPTRFSVRKTSTRGSSNVDAVQIDRRGYYVQRSGQIVNEINYDFDSQDYGSMDLQKIADGILDAGVVKLAVQYKPDIRLHCLLGDGTAAVYVVDPLEEVRAWVKVDTDGLVEDIVTLPGTEEDQVFYVVNRENGRFMEKWSKESECVGGTINKCADSHVIASGQVINNLNHLEGRQVTVWADGKYINEFTVASGQIDLGSIYTNAVIGLAYKARFLSAKLSYAAGMGAALTQRKRVSAASCVLADTHIRSLRIGTSEDLHSPLPRKNKGKVDDEDTVYKSYDDDSLPIKGNWTNDSRLYIEAQAPFPATVLASVLTISTHDKG